MIIDYREAIAPVNDPANREIVRRLNSKTVKLSMFTTPRNATWAADRGLKVEAYPLANLSFPANRNFFRVEPGDQFKFSYPQWGISNMICRVVRITEEDLETGAIQVTAIEDIDHISAEAFGEAARGKWPIETETLSALEHVGIIEAPYVLAGDSVKVIPLAAKKAGTEAGYYLYMSIDGGVHTSSTGSWLRTILRTHTRSTSRPKESWWTSTLRGLRTSTWFNPLRAIKWSQAKTSRFSGAR